MSVADGGGRIEAVLSVTDAPTTNGHLIMLSVNSPDIAHLDNRKAEIVLNGELTDFMSESSAKDYLHSSMAPPARMQAGHDLFKATIRDEVAQLWADVQAAASQDCQVKVRLDADTERLRAVPWELLRSASNWVFLLRNQFWWRGPVPQPPASGKSDDGPLRILVVVCNPCDRTQLANKELAEISGALAGDIGRCHLEVLDGPLRPSLFNQVRELKPHILHFISHGMPRVLDAITGLTINWAVSDSCGHAIHEPWELPSYEISELLEIRPRLVVINACRTAADSADPMGGLSTAFLDAGALAVVSMQADIDSKAAVIFSGKLYQSIAHGDSIDVAVSAARHTLHDELEDGSWALPVLALKTDPEDVLNIPFLRSAEAIKHATLSQRYRPLKDFLNRSPERREAWWALDPISDEDKISPIVLITGQPLWRLKKKFEPGKTWFASWCLFTCYLRGHRVTYVDLKDKFRDLPEKSNKNWLDFIRIVREACTGTAQLDPLPAAVFDAFNRRLNELVDPHIGDEGLAQTEPSTTDQWRLFNDNKRHGEKRKEDIFDEFLMTLKTLAYRDKCAHTIALDNVDFVFKDDFYSVIYPYLIEPLAKVEDSAVRVMLTGERSWLRTHIPGDGELKWIDLEGFEPGQFMRLAMDYCHRNKVKFDDYEAVLTKMCENYKQPPQTVPVQLFETLLSLMPTRTGLTGP